MTRARNAHYEPMAFLLPSALRGRRWVKVLDTREPRPAEEGDRPLVAGSQVELEARPLMVLRRAR